MRIVREKPKSELINITPLIDVVFILLVFFMLAGSIEPKDAFAISPPASTSKMRGDVQDFVILIDKDGQVAMGEEKLARDEIESRVRQALTSKPARSMVRPPSCQASGARIWA